MRLNVPTVNVAPLAVPAQLRRELDAAVAAGRADAVAWSNRVPDGTAARFDSDALASIAAPPSGSQERAELAVLHDIERRRTQAGNERATWLHETSGHDAWDAAIREIGDRHGVAQARAATALLELTIDRLGAVRGVAKRTIARARPYELDPTLTTAVPRPPAGNFSHPSGHASEAFASALVLASFLPDHARELHAAAAEVAWSRVYGAVHFPSDVVAGARLASRIATDVLRREAPVALSA